MPTVLTGDLGGTKCRFALLNSQLEPKLVRKVPTPQDRESVLAMIEREFAAILAECPDDEERPTAIGIGAAGVITRDGRSVVYAPNLSLRSTDVATRIEQALGLPTVLINDGRASALGEYRHGYAAGRDPLLCLFYGTGIGIGLVVDGKPFEGGTNAAGEIGHVQHVPDGLPCPCGRNGCYEAYCGGGPMVARAANEIGPAPGAAAAWTVDDIVALAGRGAELDAGPEKTASERAQVILHEAEVAAGEMVQSLCTLLNPSAVVLGGGVLAGWPDLRERIAARVQEWCAPIITSELEFFASKGESDAILWGAAEATGVVL